MAASWNALKVFKFNFKRNLHWRSCIAKTPATVAKELWIVSVLAWVTQAMQKQRNSPSSTPRCPRRRGKQSTFADANTFCVDVKAQNFADVNKLLEAKRVSFVPLKIAAWFKLLK